MIFLTHTHTHTLCCEAPPIDGALRREDLSVECCRRSDAEQYPQLRRPCEVKVGEDGHDLQEIQSDRDDDVVNMVTSQVQSDGNYEACGENKGVRVSVYERDRHRRGTR